MTLQQKLRLKIKALTLAGIFFASWLAALLMLKHLVLAEYSIAFSHWSLALVGALVLSKVVLVLERVSMGAWVRARPAWVDVVLRTVLYGVGVFIVLVLEKAFEGRREHGGFIRSLTAGFEEVDAHHIGLNTICFSGAPFGYNVLTVIRRHLGEGGLLRLFLTPLADEPKRNHAGS